MWILITLAFSCVIAMLTTQGFRIWWLCLFLVLCVQECEKPESPRENGREMYVRGLEVCKKADFPDVIVLKHYAPKDGHIDFMYFCVDSHGGLHIAPEPEPAHGVTIQLVPAQPQPSAVTPTTP